MWSTTRKTNGAFEAIDTYVHRDTDESMCLRHRERSSKDAPVHAHGQATLLRRGQAIAAGRLGASVEALVRHLSHEFLQRLGLDLLLQLGKKSMYVVTRRERGEPEMKGRRCQRTRRDFVPSTDRAHR